MYIKYDTVKNSREIILNLGNITSHNYHIHVYC